MRIKDIALTGLLPIMLFSCVSSKKFKGLQSKYDSLNKSYGDLQNDLKNCNSKTADLTRDKSNCDAQVDALNKQIAFLKDNNTLDNLGAKDAYIQSLQSALAHKDSLNMALVNNLKGAIGDLNDKDINIKVDKGVVYVDISDKLLFASGKYAVTQRAQEVLGKVATVLKAQPDIEFMVEGHTDNVPYRHGDLLDNWDLSVKRATAVVRILQKKYGLEPAKMAAAGRSEYVPVADNATAEGRALNRRTRIVILPQLDQFFKLLEHK
jgi:chemotaxis protein MotB